MWCRRSGRSQCTAVVVGKLLVKPPRALRMGCAGWKLESKLKGGVRGAGCVGKFYFHPGDIGLEYSVPENINNIYTTSEEQIL